MSFVCLVKEKFIIKIIMKDTYSNHTTKNGTNLELSLCFN